MKRILAWLESRLSLGATVGPMLMHPIPRGAAGPMGWWYVFGSASMTLLLIQILSGVGLALVYVPTADQAYESLAYLNDQQPLGWFLRSLHYWSGSAMVVMVVVHMTQVFLHGAYKYPRELNWLTGVLLLLVTLGMAFTGQVLRWDADAYWGVGVGASMAGRVPVLGPYVVDLLLGGPVIGGDTLSRFFALHVFVIPGLLLAFLALHLWLVLKRGISAPPVPGVSVNPRTYQEEYETELKRDSVPFFGEAMLKDALFSSLTVVVVVVLAAIAGPKGPGALPEPALLGANPKPDWPFLWLFALLSLSPPSSETLIILGMPVVLIGALVLVPFVSNRGERAPTRRPVAVLSVIVIFTVLGVLTYYGATAPVVARHGVPGAATLLPPDLVRDSSPVQPSRDACAPEQSNARNCHALEGIGGVADQDLSGVGIRLTRDQLIDQISNGTPGGGNMPAYGKQIKPAEMSALVQLLASLRFGGPGSRRVRPRSPNHDDSEPPMNPTSDAFVRSWPFDPWLVFWLLLTAGVYLRGWLVLHHRDAARWPRGRLFAFMTGLTVLFLAARIADPSRLRPCYCKPTCSSHLLPDDGRAPLGLGWLGAPFFPLLRWAAATGPRVLGRPGFSVEVSPPVVRTVDSPCPCLATLLRVSHLVLAPAAWSHELAMRSGSLALSSAHLVSRHCASVLVSGCSGRTPAELKWSPWLLIPST